MLVDRVLANVFAPGCPPDFRDRPRDLVDVPWHRLHDRAVRATSRGGRAVRVLLGLGAGLADGDVLADDAGTLLVVHVPPADVLVARPAAADVLAKIALELGNLHVPVEVTAEAELLVHPDGPAEGVLRAHRVPYARERRTFQPLRATVLNGPALATDFRVDRAG